MTRGKLRGAGPWVMRVGAVCGLVMALAAAVVAGGCAGSGEPFRPAFTPDGDAVVYIFRLGGPLYGGPVDVVIDQEPVVSLGRGQYIALRVPPGEHVVRVEGGSSSAARVIVRAGESAFLELVTAPLGGSPDLEVRQEEEALEMLAETREATVTP